MRLLVTGAGGLIGRHLVAAAAGEADIEVIASSRGDRPDLPKLVQFRPANLKDPQEAGDLIESIAPTHVINTAWHTKHPSYWEDPENLDWIVATSAMARAFAMGGGRRFVQLGSCAEYDWSHGLCVEGVTPERPATRYGKAKLAAFRALEAAAHDAFEAIEARIFFVYGPGENSSRFIPLVCRNHLKGQVPSLGSGRQWRDLLHAEDAARAILAVAVAEGVTGVVNIGSGSASSLGEAAAILAAAAGAADTGLGSHPDRPSDPIFLVPAVERLRSLGWEPRISLEEGLTRTLEWWREQLTEAEIS